MTRAEISRETRVQRQRQKARRGCDAVPAHDDRTVVQRTCSIENAQQQVVTEFGVELYAAVDDVLQPDVALDYDQRARLGRCERRCGEYHLVVNAFAKLSVNTRKRHAKPVAERD